MTQEKKVTLLDRHNQVIGEADLYEAHRHPAQYHKAVSVWLLRNFADQVQILLQKRSLEKIVGADQWGNGICGNVRPDEDFLGCAHRRLREEIGVEGVELMPLYQFEYQVYSNQDYGEHELDQVFLGQYQGEFKLNPTEVQATTWVDLTKLQSALSDKKIVSANETLSRPTQLLKELTPPLFLKLAGQDFEISPWTAIMLGDMRLWQGLFNFKLRTFAP